MQQRCINKPIKCLDKEKNFYAKTRVCNFHTDNVYYRILICFLLSNEVTFLVLQVQFKLHESFKDSQRTVMKPPYEVTETGWGEFEIIIKIYFVDIAERPVRFLNILLYIYVDILYEGKKPLKTYEFAFIIAGLKDACQALTIIACLFNLA